MASLPLEGLTVVSLEQAVAAPFASDSSQTWAPAIKVERDTGNFARAYDDKVHGMASYFVWLHRSKESIVLDLKSDDGFRVLRRLVKDADILVQNLAPGAVERMDSAPRVLRVAVSGGRGVSGDDDAGFCRGVLI